MLFDQFVELTDSWKLFLVDVNAAERIHTYTWVQDGTYTNLWKTTYTTGFPNRVVEDGGDYTERFTLAEANGNVESFYYDLENQTLYCRTKNTDDPGGKTGGEYDYNVLAFCWRHLCNSIFKDDDVIYTRQQEVLTDGGFEEWLSVNNLTHWIESIAGSSTINREDGTDHVVEGGYSARLDIDASNNFAGIYQDVILEPRGKNRIRVQYKMSLAAKTAAVVIQDIGGNVYLNSSGDWQTGSTEISLSNSINWTEFDFEFYAHKDYTNYRVMFKRASAGSSSIYLDNARLTQYREDNQYLPYFQSTDLPTIHQAVADFHIGAVKMQFGRLRFLNDGYWYDTFLNHLWHNKEMEVRYGAKKSDWEDLNIVFRGRTRKPAVSDQFAELSVSDDRVLTYKDIPTTKFWISNYPNLEDGAESLPIPIVYGEFSNIVPTCVDTTTFKYKIANHALEDIPDVYKDGVPGILGTDYTIDLANGEFTLAGDPGDSLISCDVKGKKCSMVDGTYSENVADILWDVLTTYVGIPESGLDKESFLDLRTARTQKHHLYLDVETSIFEIIRLLQASALFHLIPLASKKLGAFRYKIGTEAGTPRFVDEDYGGFKLFFETAGIYKKVKLRYNRNPGDNSYQSVVRIEDAVEWEYEETDTLSITTTLRLKAETENLGDYYKALLQNPLKKIKSQLPTVLFKYRPAEKGIFNKVKITESGPITVLSEEAYRVMDLKKNMKTGIVEVEALEDLQSAGAPFCEVCVTCQTCNTVESGTCVTCFSCQKCDSGQCTTCQSCFGCQKCDAGECTICQSCDTCQKCNAGQCTICEICVACEKCNTGECTACEICVGCEKCDTCENAQCTVCEDCVACQKCDAGECTNCQICVACEKCNTGECTTCQICVGCQKCDTGECTVCEICVGCEKCDTCQNAQCNLCESCDICQKCDSCQNAQCTTCEVCVGCQKCDAGECTTCQICVGCQKCDTGECTNCQTCVACEKCDAGECTNCQSCDLCQKCDTCENAQCSGCESCDLCQKCNTCQNAQCTICESCNICQKCNTCQNAQCTVCEDCVACQKCDAGQCTNCQICNICQKCDAGECTICETCNICQKCDAGECDACQKCVACEKCNAGECTICQSCDTCQKCNVCMNNECTICESCVACMSCVGCMVCNNCEECVECEKCFNCQLEPM